MGGGGRASIKAAAAERSLFMAVLRTATLTASAVWACARAEASPAMALTLIKGSCAGEGQSATIRFFHAEATRRGSGRMSGGKGAKMAFFAQEGALCAN